MFTITVSDTENKNSENKIVSLSYTITGQYETYTENIENTVVFDLPKDELSVTEKEQIIGTALKNSLITITNSLKAQASVQDLGQMKVIVL